MTERKRRALALASCAGVVIMPGGLLLSYPGVMAPYWNANFQMDKGDIGTAVFIMLATVGVAGFLTGRLHGRYGLRGAMLLGGLVCGLNLLLTAFARNPWFVYAWGFFNGVAVGASWNAAVTSVQLWYPQRRGFGSGVVNLAFGGSAVAMVYLLTALVNQAGYFRAHVYLGCFALLLGVAAALFGEMPQRVKGQSASAAEAPAPAAGRAAGAHSVRQSVASKNFWLLWLVYALQGAAGTAMLTFATSYGLALGYSLEAALLILFCFSITNALSRIITGYASDRMGRGFVMSLSFWAAGAAYLALLLFNYLPGIIVCASIIGFAFGTLLTVTVPLASDCFGMENFGEIFGLLFTGFGFASGALGPSLGGHILDLTHGNYSMVFIYLAILSLLSGVLVKLVKAPAQA